MTVTVLLVSGDAGHRTDFDDAFAEVAEVSVVGHVARTSDLGVAMARLAPRVVVVDDPLPSTSPFEVARRLLDRDPSVAVVLWIDRESADILGDALDCGMRAVITRPLSAEDARSKMVAAAEWSERVKENRSRTEQRPAGTLVALLGAKGGVGTSTLAVQLARVASQDGVPCVLADFDLAAGDLNNLLNLSHQRSILDLLPVLDHLDGRYLGDALYTHESGMRVLPGPAERERADEITEPAARRVLGALRSYFPVVVVDCGSRLDDANAVALEVADQALLVVTPEVPCLLAARRHLETLSRLAIRPDERTTAVVNRQSKRSEFQLAEIRRSLDISVFDAVIPEREAAFQKATNHADPDSMDDKVILRTLRRLARDVGILGVDRSVDRSPPRHVRLADA